jgi:hypothetical protein
MFSEDLRQNIICVSVQASRYSEELHDLIDVAKHIWVIKRNEMCGMCGTCGGEARCTRGFLTELEGKRYLEDFGIDGG